jgi:predicted ribosomally synthesized peptide with nif11-like leader
MASQTLALFLELVESDSELQEQVGQTDLGGILALAAERGLELRPADLLRAQAEQIMAMSDDELDLLAQGGLEDLFRANDFRSYLDRV